MADVRIRNVDPEVIEAIRDRARVHGRSLEVELRLILQAAARQWRTDFWGKTERLRKQTVGRQVTDSVDLIRADRNR